MKKLSIGLVGYGIWGVKILKELLYLNTEVHILELELRYKNEALEQGATSFETDLVSFKKYHFDGLVIASSTSSHLRLLQEFASFQIPVFVEKPLTGTPCLCTICLLHILKAWF